MSPQIFALSLLALALTACSDRSRTDSARPNGDTTLNQENVAGAPRQDVSATEMNTGATTSSGMSNGMQPRATPSPLATPSGRASAASGNSMPASGTTGTNGGSR